MRPHWTSLPFLMGVGVEKGVLGGAGLPRRSVRVGPGGARGGAEASGPQDTRDLEPRWRA